MQPGDTITVRGAGGHVFDMDVPPDGTVHREVFDDAVAKGRLTILTAERPTEAPSGPPAVTAKVAEWRDYAVSSGMDPAEAEAATKRDLIELFDPKNPDQTLAP